MLRELRAMVALAWPLVLAELGWLLMGIVDTIMVAPLGASAIGAVGAGSILFMAITMPGFGTLLALDTFVSQSYGAGRVDECHRWLFAGLQLAALLTLVLMPAAVVAVWLLPWFGFHPEVLAELAPYMTHLVWSVAPLLAYLVFRRYLQALHITTPIVIALVVANVVNFVANWLLIEGRFGLPALGVVGAAWATVSSRVVMALVAFAAILWNERRRPSGLHDVPFELERWRIRRIVTVGAPAAGQILLEVGVFAAASALAGRIAPAAVAAHQIVLNIAGFIYMIPYGIGSAAAVRVGHAVGRGDPEGARTAGWVALGLATGIMTLSAVTFATVPESLVRIFTDEASVVRVGAAVLLIAAVFQLFDGIQTVATGALRGLGETRIPMFSNLVGHWAIGLPLGYFLCFHRGWGIEGLWVGLALGLILVGCTLLAVWQAKGTGLPLWKTPGTRPLRHGDRP